MAAEPEKEIPWGKNDKSDPLYAGQGLRRCLDCPEDFDIHPLTDFNQSPRSDGTGAMWKVYCTRCKGCFRRFKKRTKKHDHKTAVSVLTTTLSKVMNSRNAKGPEFANALASACEAIGGNDKAFNSIGRVFNKAIRLALQKGAKSCDLDRAVKVGDSLLKSAMSAEKMKGPPVDLSELSQEDVKRILKEPARELLLENDEFLTEMLNDSEIRQRVLAHLGIKVIDSAEAEDVVDGPVDGPDEEAEE